MMEWSITRKKGGQCRGEGRRKDGRKDHRIKDEEEKMKIMIKQGRMKGRKEGDKGVKEDSA